MTTQSVVTVQIHSESDESSSEIPFKSNPKFLTPALTSFQVNFVSNLL